MVMNSGVSPGRFTSATQLDGHILLLERASSYTYTVLIFRIVILLLLLHACCPVEQRSHDAFLGPGVTKKIVI